LLGAGPATTRRFHTGRLIAATMEPVSDFDEIQAEQLAREIAQERRWSDEIDATFDEIDEMVRDLRSRVHGGNLHDEIDHRIEALITPAPRAPRPAGPPRLTHAHRLLHTLADRDGGWRCHYCSTPISCGCGDPALPAAVADHVLPRARRGPDTIENRVLACWPCNSGKGDRTPDEWQTHRPRPPQA
jgi:hypothetical protein